MIETHIPQNPKLDPFRLIPLITTIILSVSLFIVINLLSGANKRADDLNEQVRAGDAQTLCRTRFANEDERLDRLGDISFRAALLAASERDTAAIARIAAYNRILSPAAIQASLNRTSSADACKLDPTLVPVPATIPPFPE